MLRTRTAVGLSFIALMPGLLAASRATSPAAGDGGGDAKVIASAAPASVSAWTGVRTDTLPVPTDPHELRAWLASGTYKTWDHQDGPSPADSPHGDQAQVFLSPSLAQSVHARKPSHHQGAAAVLEMSDAEGLVWGWAVAVKAHASSNHGQGWYWYQVKSGPDSGKTSFGDHMIPGDPDEAGLGVPTCLSCHVKGHDYVITRSLN